MAVDLNDIAEAFDLVTPDWEDYGGAWFVDRDNDKVWFIPSDLAVFLESEDTLLNDKNELVEDFDAILKDRGFGYLNIEYLVKAFMTDCVFIEPLDSRDQYRFMEKFIANLDDQRPQELLYAAIDDKGTFRRFKDTAFALGLLQHYFEFRETALLEKAKEWCEENGFEYK